MDKLFLIIISAVHLSVADVRAKLELGYLKPIDTLSLANAQTVANHISIGQQGDQIYIVSNNLASNFFHAQPSDFEERVRKNFPDAEVVVLELNDRVKLYGYAILKNGKRQRVKSGAENVVYIDEGKPLPEETAVVKETVFNKEELQDIKKKYTRQEANAIIGNAAGIKVIPVLLQHYLNADDDTVNTKINAIQLTEYQ